MANTRNYNRSFSGGEISPEMYGRIDADKYQTGASKIVNMIVKPQGPVKNRPGLQFVNTTKNPAVPSRLIRFRYSVVDSIVVELGNECIRFHKNGGTIGAGSVPALKRGPCTITSSVSNISFSAHSFVDGEQVSFSATVGNITLGTIYYVVNSAANTFQISLTPGGVAVVPSAGGTPNVGKVYYLSDLVSSASQNFYAKGQVLSASNPPVAIPTPVSNAYWHHMPNGVYEVPSPYGTSDIFDVTYSQSNDVMTFAHPSYGVKELRRYGDTHWEIVGVSFDATCLPPTIVGYGKKGGRIAIDRTQEYDEPGSNDAIISVSFSAPQIGVGDKITFSGTNTTYLDDEIYLINEVNASSKWVSYNKFETGTLLSRSMNVKFNTDTISVHDGVSPSFTSIPHGLKNGAVIYFPTGSTPLPVGVATSTLYYVSNVTDLTFRIASSPGGTPLSFAATTAGNSAFHRVSGGFYQPLNETLGFDNSYKVTSIHEDTTESGPSNALALKNNIYAATAFNVIAWDRVSDAAKYKVYKQQAGLYGYIGGSDQIEQYEYTNVGSSINNPTIFTIPTGHDLVDNAPVKLYQNSGGGPALPPGITQGNVYFVKRIDEGVDSGGFYLLSDINGSPISANATGTGPYKLVKMQFFIDDNIAPDMGITPPIRDANDLNSPDNYPRAVGHFEQRRCFGGTSNDPQSLWMSRSGTENDFSYSIPVKDDDRVKFEVAARELNTIRHVVPMQNLVLLTDTAEWRVTSINADAITPSSVSIRPQSYIGANNVQPEIVNNSLVYCAARGGHVREMGYNWQAQGFVTGDLSMRAAHLFDSYELEDMTYCKSPLPILWFVSSSGKLLGLTYVPEEQVAAWHQHETDGSFISCASIPEQEEDRLYVVVKRTIEGADNYYIERMAPIEVSPNIADAVYVDSAVTASNVVAFTTVTGLDHLEGKTVSVLADGKVYTKVVSAGEITLDVPALKAHVGLPYVSDLQTLPITLQVDGFGQGRNYNVNKAWVRVFQTAGVKIGPSADKLVAANPYSTTPSLQDTTVQVLVTPSWQDDGQIYIRQTEPLPMTVVGLTFEVSVGG